MWGSIEKFPYIKWRAYECFLQLYFIFPQFDRSVKQCVFAANYGQMWCYFGMVINEHFYWSTLPTISSDGVLNIRCFFFFYVQQTGSLKCGLDGKKREHRRPILWNYSIFFQPSFVYQTSLYVCIEYVKFRVLSVINGLKHSDSSVAEHNTHALFGSSTQ